MAARTKKTRQIGHFGRLVREHRERLGFTMNELARKIEMDQGLLSKIERGKRPPPQLVPQVQRIAAALGLEVESAKFKELMEVAYRERFGKQENWPSILSITASEKGKGLVLKRQPVVPRGLHGYAPSETSEIIPPDSPMGQHFKLLSDAEVLERLEAPLDRSEMAKGYLQAYLAICAEIIESQGAPPDQSELARTFLQSCLERCGLNGWHITHLEHVGEVFNLECQLPNGKQYEIRISPKREHREV